MRKYSFLFTLYCYRQAVLPKTKISVISFTDKFAPIFITIAVPTKETVDGLFYMYPKDKIYDTDGKDLNATANGSFYTLYTRLGVDVQGPKLGRAKTSAKVEMDFRGSGTTFSTVRLRHAYLNLDWGKPSLLFGSNLASAVW